MLPDWLAAVRLLQATTLPQATFQYKSPAAKSWECEGKQHVLSDTTAAMAELWADPPAWQTAFHEQKGPTC